MWTSNSTCPCIIIILIHSCHVVLQIVRLLGIRHIVFYQCCEWRQLWPFGASDVKKSAAHNLLVFVWIGYIVWYKSFETIIAGTIFGRIPSRLLFILSGWRNQAKLDTISTIWAFWSQTQILDYLLPRLLADILTYLLCHLPIGLLHGAGPFSLCFQYCRAFAAW